MTKTKKSANAAHSETGEKGMKKKKHETAAAVASDAEEEAEKSYEEAPEVDLAKRKGKKKARSSKSNFPFKSGIKKLVKTRFPAYPQLSNSVAIALSNIVECLVDQIIAESIVLANRIKKQTIGQNEIQTALSLVFVGELRANALKHYMLYVIYLTNKKKGIEPDEEFKKLLLDNQKLKKD